MSVAALRRARLAVAALVVADLLALVAFAFHRTTTLTDVTTAAPAPRPVEAAVPALPAPAPLDVTAAAPISLRVSAGAPATAAAPQPVSGFSSAPVPPGPVAPAAGPRVAACPLPVQRPAQTGGVQSLITLAPAFGPYSAEAFAAASAYQPVLELVGPVLAEYPALAPTVEPLLEPLLAGWEALLLSGYDVTSPFYSPYRQQVLKAETQLATVLAPYAQQLAASAGASCLIGEEAALLSLGGA